MKYISLAVVVVMICCQSCNPIQKPLPVKGKINQRFVFVNQDGTTVTENTVANKIYVTDFFFTTCPTICPTMKTQMLRIHEKFKNRNDFLLLSHSIDSKDTVEVLKDYAERLEVSSKDWHFVTGERKQIFGMAKTYMVTAGVDVNAEGGYIHSGSFVLIDKKGQVRGFYDGTKEDDVDVLIQDIDRLINESK